MRIRFIAKVFLVCASLFAAGGKPEGVVDSTAAFAHLKTLVGEWQAGTNRGKSTVVYELIAGGTSLLERESAGKSQAMLTVYHMDGARLLLTHYCMAGNQPRMEARSFDPKTGELHFEFVDGTNLAGNQGHMHNAAFRLVDKDHFTSTWEFFQGGQLRNAETFNYVRVR